MLKEIVNSIRNIIYKYGCPYILHTDNGKEFCNKFMEKLCFELNIKHVRGRARLI